MTNQTLFGKSIESLVNRDADSLLKKHVRSNTTDLPLNIRATILDGLDAVERSFICAIANSTVQYGGAVIDHAVMIPDGGVTDDYRCFLYETLTSTQEGNERLFKQIEPVYSWVVNIMKPGVYEMMKNASRERIKKYSKKKYALDMRLFARARSGTLSWEDVSKGCEKKSALMLAARAFVSPRPKNILAVHSDTSSLQSMFSAHQTPRLVSLSGERVSLFHYSDPICINPVYVGGNPYAKGAESLAALIEKDIVRLKGDTDDFNCFDSRLHVVHLYHTLRFLEKQGYVSVAKQLREKLTVCFTASLSRYIEYIGPESEQRQEDIDAAAYAAQCFLETAQATEEPAVFQKILSQVKVYREIFAMGHENFVLDQAGENYAFLENVFADEVEHET